MSHTSSQSLSSSVVSTDTSARVVEALAEKLWRRNFEDPAWTWVEEDPKMAEEFRQDARDALALAAEEIAARLDEEAVKAGDEYLVRQHGHNFAKAAAIVRAEYGEQA